MKASWIGIFTALMVFGLAGCAPKSPTPPELPAGSMKGFELYSWQEGNQWYYSVLIGTNREKTLDEIKSSETRLADLGALEAALKKIRPGEDVFWGLREGLAFPPEAEMNQIKQICSNQGLT